MTMTKFEDRPESATASTIQMLVEKINHALVVAADMGLKVELAIQHDFSVGKSVNTYRLIANIWRKVE